MSVGAAIVGGVVGGLVAVSATWLFRRITIIENFFEEAVGATWALAKAKPGEKSWENAEHLAGVVLPLADTLGLRVRSVRNAAREWADALNDMNVKEARQAQEKFRRKARFAGFGR